MLVLISCGGGTDDGGDAGGGSGLRLDDFDVASPWSGEGTMTITMDGVTEEIDGFRCVREWDDGTTSIGAEGGPWVSGESFNFTLTTTPGGMTMELWERGKETGTWQFVDEPAAADSFSGVFEMWSTGDEDQRMVDVSFTCTT